jgi:capsular polysaccharide biosynthesis protein
LKASVPKGTDMVKISLNSSEPQLAKKIISELLNIISTAIQKEQDLSIQKIKSKMEAVILNHKMLEESVSQAKKQAAESKLKIDDLKNKIDDLKKKKFEALINNNGDALTLLLYINEIRNSQVYFNELNDKVAELENSYQNISLRLEQFRLNLEDIKGTVIRKEPTILEKPIKPNKKLIVATTFVGSFMVAVMLAFLFEFVSRLREA